MSIQCARLKLTRPLSKNKDAEDMAETSFSFVVTHEADASKLQEDSLYISVGDILLPPEAYTVTFATTSTTRPPETSTTTSSPPCGTPQEDCFMNVAVDPDFSEEFIEDLSSSEESHTVTFISTPTTPAPESTTTSSSPFGTPQEVGFVNDVVEADFSEDSEEFIEDLSSSSEESLIGSSNEDPEEEEGASVSEEYYVEKIILMNYQLVKDEHKVLRPRTKFFVKWWEWPQEHNSWVYEDDMGSDGEIIMALKANLAETLEYINSKEDADKHLNLSGTETQESTNSYTVWVNCPDIQEPSLDLLRDFN